MSVRTDAVRAGDPRAVASLIRDLDDARPDARLELTELGRAGPVAAPLVVGITGPPGAGKSTLVDALVAAYRARQTRVAVVAVDPSSPVSGGAVLGDRVRMQRHALDDGVFVRSVATRGAAGGLARSVGDIVTVLGAAGFPVVLVETVGVGQGELDVAVAADVTVLVTVPGLGDEVQTLKSGLSELADVLVVNKADRPEAERTLAELRAAEALTARGTGAGAGDPGERAGDGATGDGAAAAGVPGARAILATVATTGQGVEDLLRAIDDRAALQSLPEARRARAVARVRLAFERRLLAMGRATAEGLMVNNPAIAQMIDGVAAGSVDVASVVEALLGHLGFGVESRG